MAFGDSWILAPDLQDYFIDWEPFGSWNSWFIRFFLFGFSDLAVRSWDL